MTIQRLQSHWGSRPCRSVAGPRWEFVIAPGALQVRTRDWAKAARTEERETARGMKEADAIAAGLSDTGGFPVIPPPSREITGWSRKSRCNMAKTYCQIDYSELFADPTRLSALVTLTYPGCREGTCHQVPFTASAQLSTVATDCCDAL